MRFDVPIPGARCERAAALLAALAHPVRLRIVCGLLEGGCCVSPIVDGLGLPQALVSRHLAILREAGVVAVAPEGRRRVYRVVHPAVPALVHALEQTLLGGVA
jgi:ArsR family transcriptional regulator, zinc-responsive transcriptional repressor